MREKTFEPPLRDLRRLDRLSCCYCWFPEERRGSPGRGALRQFQFPYYDGSLAQVKRDFTSQWREPP
jgi:hypothetical protein